MLQDTTAILLAAGESTRFGPNNKLLERINGKPILHQCMETLLASNVGQVVVITGHNHMAIERSLKAYQTPNVSICFNRSYQQGQSSSVHAGILQCRERSAILVCLADMPKVKTATVNCLLQSAEDNPDNDIIAPLFNEKRGNPVLFKQSLFSDLLNIKGDTGAKHYIEQHSERLTLVSVNDPGIHQDFDSPLDFLGSKPE